MKVVGVFLALAIAFAAFYSCKPGRSRAVVTKTAAPPAPLVIGSEGKLAGKTWQVRGHTVIEIAQVGRVHDRHEYDLADADDNRALLVCGLKPGDADWALFTPLEPSAPLTPVQAAALRVGDEVNLDGWVGRVSRLLQSVVVARELESSDSPDVKVGRILFGFDAQSGSTPLLVRWSESGILFYRGETLPAKSAVEAFTRKAGS
jgi:hypothetical protein